MNELTEVEKIAQAVSEGYPDVDQKCSECGTIFKNYHHFILCDSETCPMVKDKRTIFVRMLEEMDKK